MRWIICRLIVGLYLVTVIEHVGAQDIATIQNVISRIHTPYKHERLEDYLFEHNICLEEFAAANLDLLDDSYANMTQADVLDWFWVGIEVRNSSPRVAGPIYIPQHEPCYDIYQAQPETLAQLEKDINVCVEEFYFWGRPVEAYMSMTVYVRRDALPCVNEQGQRLQYYASYWEMLDQPYYSKDRFTDNRQELAQYCTRDLMRANPGWYTRLNSSWGFSSWVPDVRLFIPDNAPFCRPVNVVGKDLYEISQDENVCMETMLESSASDLFRNKQIAPDFEMMAPVNAPDCYDENGQRLNAADRLIYTPQQPESFLDIARQHGVCLQDLWQANPAMKSWGGLYYFLPDVVFIPETPSCDFTHITFMTETHQTLYAVSLLTNVCMNRLIEANPHYPQLATLGWTEEFGEVLTLTIPKRHSCYKLYGDETEYGLNYYSGNIFDYVCYSVMITPNSDFIGHNPPITASDDTSLPYCEERRSGMTVFYENTPYTLYEVQGWDTMITLGQCFGVDPYDLIDLSSRYIPETVRPIGSILIPQPHKDCWLTQVDFATYRQKIHETSYKAGYLIDGVYTVNYQDTLGSIGRTYGYLPQAIADANNLPDPGMIYYLQELKMPDYPSFYTLIPIGGAGTIIVLIGTVIYGLRRWTRNRYTAKKKNDAA